MPEPSDEELVDFPDYPPLDETGMVDLWQIEANLAMTPAQRIQKFARFLEVQEAFRRAGKKLYGNVSRPDSQAP
jgi:hypothetical protein